MESPPWSTAEKEPFLYDDAGKMPRRLFWESRYILAVSMVIHIVLFSILGGTLVLTVKSTILNAALPNSPQKAPEFGGLPVQYNDPTGPYIICPSTGGPSSAFEAGCQMDLFANGWVPGPCFDAEKHAYFVSLHDYRFWADEEKKHRVHQDALLSGTLEYPELFVSFEEHWEHCRYLLNGTQRHAHDPRLGILDIHMDTEHINHCIDFLQESRDPYNLEKDVIAYFGYRKCFLPRLHLASAARDVQTDSEWRSAAVGR